MSKTYIIPAWYYIYGKKTVEADSLEEALKKHNDGYHNVFPDVINREAVEVEEIDCFGVATNNEDQLTPADCLYLQNKATNLPDDFPYQAERSTL